MPFSFLLFDEDRNSCETLQTANHRRNQNLVQLYKLAERLANDREDYKAADSLLKLAKVQGWIGFEPDSLWATFSKLSQADIDKVKERLKAQVDQKHEEGSRSNRGR